MSTRTFPTRLSSFITNILDALVEEEKPSTKLRSGKELPKARCNRLPRKDLFYYMQLRDDTTKEFVGHLADISSGGFKLDSQNPIPVNQDIRFLMNLSSEVADKPSIVFTARSRWCKTDPLDPSVYNVGYQLVHISPGDLEIFNRMMEKYGREYEKRTIDLRRSNRW
jgi:hypothetical protein